MSRMNPGTNSVMISLQAGKVNLKGRKMYYIMPNHPNVLVPVRIRGFSIAKGSREVCIEASVCGGDGMLRVDPRNLVDRTKAARDYYARRRAAAAYIKENGFTDYGSTITTLRSTVSRELATLSKKHQALVLAELGEVPVGKQDTCGLRRAGQRIAELKFDINTKDEGCSE